MLGLVELVRRDPADRAISWVVTTAIEFGDADAAVALGSRRDRRRAAVARPEVAVAIATADAGVDRRVEAYAVRRSSSGCTTVSMPFARVSARGSSARPYARAGARGPWSPLVRRPRRRRRGSPARGPGAARVRRTLRAAQLPALRRLEVRQRQRAVLDVGRGERLVLDRRAGDQLRGRRDAVGDGVAGRRRRSARASRSRRAGDGRRIRWRTSLRLALDRGAGSSRRARSRSDPASPCSDPRADA